MLRERERERISMFQEMQRACSTVVPRILGRHVRSTGTGHGPYMYLVYVDVAKSKFGVEILARGNSGPALPEHEQHRA